MRVLGALLIFPAACASPAASELEPIVERFRPALRLEGNAERGKLLYGKSCLHCHRAGGEGHDLGPDLASFRSRTSEQLLVDLVDPNREVRPEHRTTKVLTKDGSLLDGVLVAEDAAGVTLRRAYGESDTVPRAEIERIDRTALSAMPEGLEQGLDLQQVADLLAFMRAFSGK